MTDGRLGYAAETVELCLEVGDMPWEETGEWPEVYETELDGGVNAGVPEDVDCDEFVAIIGAPE